MYTQLLKSIYDFHVNFAPKGKIWLELELIYDYSVIFKTVSEVYNMMIET